MYENAFDKGYDIEYQPGRDGYAMLRKSGCLPIIELYRVKVDDKVTWFAKKEKKLWFIRELSLTDDPINEVLPKDWQTMKYRGFDSIDTFRRWVRGV